MKPALVNHGASLNNPELDGSVQPAAAGAQEAEMMKELGNKGKVVIRPCVGGSWLTPRSAIENQDWQQITKFAAGTASLHMK